MVLTSCQGTFTEILDLTPSPTPPVSPEYGQAWLDSSMSPPKIKIWNGSQWVDSLDEAMEEVNAQFSAITSGLSKAQQDILEQAGLINSQGQLIAGNTATIESHSETLTDHSARIQAAEDAILLKVDTQTYTQDKATINASIASNLTTAKGYTDAQISVVNTSLETATAAIEVLQERIALKVEQTDIDTAVASVKLYADNAAETVLETATEQINTVKSEITQDLTSITSRVSSAESSITSINGEVSSLSNRISSAELKITEEAITQVVSKTFATKSSVDGKVDQDTVISAINQSAEKIKIIASKIELTGSVTFDMFDSATQSKITDAQTNAERAFDKADLAQTDASSASSAATAAQNTADQAWDKADTAQSDASSASTAASAAQNTADQAWDKADMAQSWTNSYGTRTNNLYTMVTKWTDGAVSATTEINGGWIQTNTLTADKIAVGDFTNYATVNEFNENSMIPSSGVYGGTKRYNPGSGWELQRYDYTKSNRLALCDYTPNIFRAGDKVAVELEIYSYRKATPSVNVIFFSSDKKEVGNVYAAFNPPSQSWSKISNLVISINSVPATAAYFIVCVDFNNSTTNDAVRKCMFRRMLTGNMIVDGSITAEKIYVTDLNTLNATVANWHMASNYLWSQSGTNRYSVIKSDGDVMIATNSPSYTDTTGATCQIWHDGHITVGDTKNGGIRTEIDGDTFEMFNQGGYAFQLNYNGGMELWGNASGNKTPYIDFHYSGSMQDYSVRLICNGADTLMVDGGTLNTASDISLKEDVKTLDKQFETFFRAIIPIAFRYKEKSQKMQIGYNANNIEEAILGAGMDPADLGLYHVDDEGIRSLAYMEFSPLNTYMIQRCMDRIAALEEEILRLKTAAA